MAKVALSYGHGSNTYKEKHSKGVTVNGVAYEEHTFNATVGEKVRKILVDHGVEVLVVQPPFGRDVSLTTRTNNANAWGADIYWSIHANAGASSARGLCGFYWGTSSTGRRLAELYAKYCKAENFPVYSGDYMYPSEKGTWSYFWELRETNMPALLTENGFMTNPEDFKLIFKNEDNFHDRLAVVHAKAILEYFGIAYKGTQAASTTTNSVKQVEIQKEEEEMIDPLMIDLVGKKKLDEIGDVYSAARIEGILSSTEWEIYAYNGSLRLSQWTYLETIINARRYKKIQDQLNNK